MGKPSTNNQTVHTADDQAAIKHAVGTFTNLSDTAILALQDLNSRVQAHTGAWGESKGGEKNENGAIQMPYWVSDPLVDEFVSFLNKENIIVPFDWGSWEDGRTWYKDTSEAKYSNLETETSLKLLTAVIRNNRYRDGALVGAFKSGDFPKIINSLATSISISTTT